MMERLRKLVGKTYKDEFGSAWTIQAIWEDHGTIVVSGSDGGWSEYTPDEVCILFRMDAIFVCTLGGFYLGK